MFTESLKLLKRDIKTMFTENLHSILSKRNMSRPIMLKYFCWLMTV